jgi:1,5-anhydro-D-fructose reductase (1,5-anhydro-D-mannitol-forming)
MDKLRFGIIGCGSIAGGSFAPSLLQSAKAELVAVCRRDLAQAEEFAQKFGGCAAYGSAAELLDDEGVQAVIVATPTDTHCEYSVLAAEKSKHVLCEKPMAHNAAECRQMIQACRQNGVKIGVAYRRRLFPQVLKAKELIAAGRIGPMVCARTHYSGWSGGLADTWRTQPGIGGAMMEMAVHRLEVLLHFGGTPARVAAMVETIHHDWPVDDTDALLVQFEGGMVGLHSTILTSRPRRDQAQIDGTEGKIYIDSLEYHVDHINLETESGVEKIAVEPLENPYFDLPMIDDFVDAVREDREPVCDGPTGFRVQATVDAAMNAAREGRTVDVEAWVE